MVLSESHEAWPETGSSEDVNRLWDQMTRRGRPSTAPRRVQFWLVCPNEQVAKFMAQYLERSQGFLSKSPRPSISEDGEEYWALQVTSPEAPLSLAFLRDACGSVLAAAKRFRCRLSAWGSAGRAA